MSTRDKLRSSLPADREYRHAYADEILNLLVCTQIRVLREQQSLTQAQLAAAIGTTQTVISRIESTEYTNWNIRTLKRLADAFDLRLRITFENFGTLWQDVSSLNRDALERAKSIQDDPEFNAVTGVARPQRLADLTQKGTLDKPQSQLGHELVELVKERFINSYKKAIIQAWTGSGSPSSGTVIDASQLVLVTPDTHGYVSEGTSVLSEGIVSSSLSAESVTLAESSESGVISSSGSIVMSSSEAVVMSVADVVTNAQGVVVRVKATPNDRRRAV